MIRFNTGDLTPVELTRARAEYAEAARIAQTRGALKARPCNCDSPAWDRDADSDRFCLWCGRRPA